MPRNPRSARGSVSRSGRALRLLDGDTAVVILGLAAGAALAPAAHPSASPWVDAGWCIAGAVAIVTFASRARRWSLLVLAGATATLASLSLGPGMILGLLAMALALATVVRGRRHCGVGALIAALCLPVLGRVPSLGFHGLPTVLCAVALAPVAISGFRNCRRDTRRRIIRSAGVVALTGGALVVVFGLLSLTARQHLETGADQARRATEALRGGDRRAAVHGFDAAAAEFGAADANLREAWLVVGLPVIGQNVAALRTVTDSGYRLAHTGSDAAAGVPYDELRSATGQIDLALLASMEGPSRTAAVALRQARADIDLVTSPWLLAPVARGVDELTAELDRTLPQAELAADGIAAAPDLLGANGRRRYLVLFANPAEARLLGGFVGGYAAMIAEHGKVTLERSGPIDEIADAPGFASRTLHMPDEYTQRYGRFRVDRFFQNVTASPDFPTDAEAVRQLYPQSGGDELDGAMYVDPYALAGFLRLIGPIAVEGLDKQLTADNIVDFLLKDQYTNFSRQSTRQDYLAHVARQTFDALTRRDLPGPRDIADALGPSMRDGRLLFTSFHPSDQRFLDRLGCTGRFARPEGSDYLSVRSSNTGGNKIDAFLSRTVDYQATVDPDTGHVSATASIAVHNDAPSGGLPNYVIGNSAGEATGTNISYVSVYTPLRLKQATINGASAATEPQHEFGGQVYSVSLAVAPASTSVLTLDLEGDVAPSAVYTVALLPQASVEADLVSVTIRTADPAVVVTNADGLDQHDDSWTTRRKGGESTVVSLGFSRQG